MMSLSALLVDLSRAVAAGPLWASLSFTPNMTAAPKATPMPLRRFSRPRRDSRLLLMSCVISLSAFRLVSSFITGLQSSQAFHAGRVGAGLSVAPFRHPLPARRDYRLVVPMERGTKRERAAA